MPVAAPVIPSAERLTVDHLHTNSTHSDADGGRHRLSLRISGSAQMMLVVPEDRLVGWSLAPGVPPPRRSPFAPHERVIFAFLTSGGGDRAGRGRRTWNVSSFLHCSFELCLPLLSCRLVGDSPSANDCDCLCSRCGSRCEGRSRSCSQRMPITWEAHGRRSSSCSQAGCRPNSAAIGIGPRHPLQGGH